MNGVVRRSGDRLGRTAKGLGAFMIITIAVALLTVGCGGPEGEEDSETPNPSVGEGEALSRSTEEGPIRATVTLSPSAPRLGDRLVLTLEVEAESGVAVEMPAFGEALGRFSIVDYTPREETDPEGRTLASQRYTLQAPMSGTQRIPPLRIEFLDERPGHGPADDSEEYRELLTEELSVTIASVLPEGAVANELRPVRGELQEVSVARNGLLALAVVAAVAAMVAIFLFWRRRAAERVRITAYDRALRRMEALESRGLPTPEAADAWYVELSDIIRRYLEDRYGIHAPELTTEEFLQEARRAANLSSPHRKLLSSFLEKCDRVKFAAYHPQESESKDILNTAHRFLSETRIVVEEGTAVPEKTAA